MFVAPSPTAITRKNELEPSVNELEPSCLTMSRHPGARQPTKTCHNACQCWLMPDLVVRPGTTLIANIRTERYSFIGNDYVAYREHSLNGFKSIHILLLLGTKTECTRSMPLAYTNANLQSWGHPNLRKYHLIVKFAFHRRMSLSRMTRTGLVNVPTLTDLTSTLHCTFQSILNYISSRVEDTTLAKTFSAGYNFT